MARKPTDAELKHGIAAARIDASARVINTLLKWGAIAAIAYFSDDAIKSLSGKTTLAQIAVSVFGSFKVSERISYGVATGCAGWALLERRMRRKKIAEQSQRIIDLELSIDKGRSSSKLTPRGTTQLGD